MNKLKELLLDFLKGIMISIYAIYASGFMLLSLMFIAHKSTKADIRYFGYSMLSTDLIDYKIKNLLLYFICVIVFTALNVVSILATFDYIIKIIK